jgi:hypothetical protein
VQSRINITVTLRSVRHCTAGIKSDIASTGQGYPGFEKLRGRDKHMTTACAILRLLDFKNLHFSSSLALELSLPLSFGRNCGLR